MWLWIIAATASYFIKGLCGFANTLVFTSILGFGANNVDISPIDLVLGYPANIILTWKHRKELNPRVFIPLALLVITGSIPGALLLKNINAQYIKIVFGVALILICVQMLIREYRPKQAKSSRILLGIIGLLAGVMCGLFGVGALLAAYVSQTTDTTRAFKANISAVFIADNTFRLILYIILGVFSWSSLKLSLLLLPFMLVGLFAGMTSSKFLNEALVKKLVIFLLILSGLVLIVKNI